MKRREDMKKKIAAVFLAGMTTAALTAGSVQAAVEPEGELYVFIAASLSNAMDEIPRQRNRWTSLWRKDW